jgi:hypothetical protein
VNDHRHPARCSDEAAKEDDLLSPGQEDHFESSAAEPQFGREILSVEFE